jgi:hypothetical protein
LTASVTHTGVPLGGWQERLGRITSTSACERDVNKTTICSRSGLGPKESSCRIAKPSGERGRLTGERGARPGNSTSVKEVPVLERLKLRDWTFSATAETVIGVLLALVIVACLFA